MTVTLLSLLALLVGVLLWLDGARARELATAVVDELCNRRGYQLLDGTVGLKRMGLAGSQQGLRLKRLFGFDYSVEGVGRRQGHILLHGTQVVLVDLPSVDEITVGASEDPPSAPARPGQPSGDRKVIPFRRRD